MIFPSATNPGTSNTGDFEAYTYDLQGNMTGQRLRSGETVNMSYDARNRLAVKDVPGSANEDVYYIYNQVNDMVSALYGSTGGSGITYGWDALGRKVTESSYGRTVTSEYDAGGNRTCLKYPDNDTVPYHIQYTYDVLGRMKEVRQRDAASCGGGSSTVMAEYAYDDLSRVTAITRANGAGTSASYNSSSQSWSLSQNLASTGQDVTYAMTYTPSGQVLTRGIDNAAYQYAATSGANTYCANGLNQYAKVENSSSACSGGQTYTYDGRGNLLSDGPRTFAYDLENKLTRVTGPGSSGTPTDWNTANWNAFQWSGATTIYLGYDPQGRLRQTDAAAGTKQYLYDGDALLVEYDAAGAVLRRYVPGQGVDETLVWYEGDDFDTPNWLHTDQQGSVVAASNSSGVSAATYAYGPYGEPSGGFASGGPAFRYTGQVQLPAHNLYYYKARMYDPGLGRFLQTDPIGYEAGLNLYAYVENDPTNATDPSGMLTCEDFNDPEFECSNPTAPGGPLKRYKCLSGWQTEPCTSDPLLPSPDFGFQTVSDTRRVNDGANANLNATKNWPSKGPKDCSTYPAGGALQYVCSQSASTRWLNSVRGCLQSYFDRGAGVYSFSLGGKFAFDRSGGPYNEDALGSLAIASFIKAHAACYIDALSYPRE